MERGREKRQKSNSQSAAAFWSNGRPLICIKEAGTEKDGSESMLTLKPTNWRMKPRTPSGLLCS